ncbi:MAG: hypothetical protein ACRDKT_06285 [Actinomycetota bacterium]
MGTIKHIAAVVATVILATLVPVAAHADPPRAERDSGIVGQGTWLLGDATLTCDRNQRSDELMFEDHCNYKADSGSDEDPEAGCIEVAVDAIVGGCRAQLAGTTKTESAIPDICMQGGSTDGEPEYPAGRPDGKVIIFSSALNKSYAVPVSITLNGSYARVFGVHRVNEGPVGQIIVDGKFLWNTDGEQKCPIQGTEPTSGVWHGQYVFFSDDID